MKRVNHILHAILSLITGGLWLPVWAVLALREGRRRRIYDDAVRTAELAALRRGNDRD